MSRLLRIFKLSLMFVVPGVFADPNEVGQPSPYPFAHIGDDFRYPSTIAAGDGFAIPTATPPLKKHHHRHTNKMTRMERLAERRSVQNFWMRTFVAGVHLGFITYLGVKLFG